MLSRLRRLRVVAAVLMLGVPGLGGAWLQLLHPCPVDMPGMHQAAAPDGPMPADHHGDQAAHRCHCIGACTTAPAVLPATGSVALVAPLRPAVAGRPDVAAADAPAAHPHLLHPPSTAPPAV